MPLHTGIVGREKVNCRAAAREAGLGHDLGAPNVASISRRGAHCAPENTMPLAAPLRRARRLGAPKWPGPRLGAPCMPNHTDTFAAMRRRHTRGETRSFSPLANHPFSFGREQAHRSLPEDLRHLLPQIRARFARKVRNTKLSAAGLPKTTRRAGSTPRGRAVQPVVGARSARPENDAAMRRRHARGGGTKVPPASCESPPLPSGRAARAKVSVPFRLPPVRPKG